MKTLLISLLFAVSAHAQITVLGSTIKDAPPGTVTPGSAAAASASAPVASSSSEELTLDAIQNEMEHSAPAAPIPSAVVTRTKVLKKKKANSNNMYVMAVGGTSGYTEVSNVTGSYAVSGAVGYFWDSFMLELGAGMSKYTMDVRNFSTFSGRNNYDVDAYNFQAGAKYRILDGSIVPIAGVVLAYTNRKFTVSNATQNAFSVSSTTSGDSQTVDAGISAGVDYEFNHDYALGVDLKYMFNISNSASSSNNNTSNMAAAGYSGTPIESLSYYVAGISGRMNF